MPKRATRSVSENSHIVLAYIARTEDAIRSNIVYAVCKILGESGAACDLRRKPSDYGFKMQRWLTEAQNIAVYLQKTYPNAKISNTEAKPYHGKPLEAFCALLFEKITKK